MVQGPGENAGVIDAGDGWGLAFKIESHNHPSAVEPYQGAATGAGGILRDVFTMGARPIALFDSLHFGSLESPRARYLLDGEGSRPFLRMNSNSYLSLSHHPEVLAAADAASHRFGAGPGAVRFIDGTCTPGRDNSNLAFGFPTDV